jgi:hypothetical protein
VVGHLVYININLFPMFYYIVLNIIYICVCVILDNISRFGIMDIPLDNELNLHTVHHIDIWGHL